MIKRTHRIGSKIGTGAFASVHLARYHVPNSYDPNQYVKLACKIVEKEKATHEYLNKFLPRELVILRKVNNPHIIRVYDIVEKQSKIFIFMTYAENGDLLRFIRKNGPITENLAKTWFKQIAKGMKYLQDEQIAHRDLKCENILLTKNYDVLITDFGFARYCYDKNKAMPIFSETFCGSSAYSAPEVISGMAYNPMISDVWSLGVILFVMLNGRAPFDDSIMSKLLDDQLSKNYEFSNAILIKLTNIVRSLLDHLLEPDISARLTLSQILTHEWIYHH